MLAAQIYSQQSLPQIFFLTIHCKARSAHTIALIAPFATCTRYEVQRSKAVPERHCPEGNAMAEQRANFLPAKWPSSLTAKVNENVPLHCSEINSLHLPRHAKQ